MANRMQNGPFSGLNMDGKLIIKAQLGADIRKIPIMNDDITYDELILMMQRLYKGKFSPMDNIILKYKDEDDDLVTLNDDSDITFAIQCTRVLKIVIYVNEIPQPLEADSTKHIRSELQLIRNQVNALLDFVNGNQSKNITGEGDHEDDLKTLGSTDAMQNSKNAKIEEEFSKPSPPKPVVSSKEFDPLAIDKSLQPSSSNITACSDRSSVSSIANVTSSYQDKVQDMSFGEHLPRTSELTVVSQQSDPSVNKVNLSSYPTGSTQPPPPSNASDAQSVPTMGYSNQPVANQQPYSPRPQMTQYPQQLYSQADSQQMKQPGMTYSPRSGQPQQPQQQQVPPVSRPSQGGYSPSPQPPAGSYRPNMMVSQAHHPQQQQQYPSAAGNPLQQTPVQTQQGGPPQGSQGPPSSMPGHPPATSSPMPHVTAQQQHQYQRAPAQQQFGAYNPVSTTPTASAGYGNPPMVGPPPTGSPSMTNPYRGSGGYPGGYGAYPRVMGSYPMPVSTATPSASQSQQQN